MAELATESRGNDIPIGERTKLRPIANICASSSCPTVYHDADSGDLVVQGFDVSADSEGIDVPAGESLVRVPVELLVEAMRNLN